MKQSFYVKQLLLGDLYKEINDAFSEASSKVFSILSDNFSIEKFISREIHNTKHYNIRLSTNDNFLLCITHKHYPKKIISNSTWKRDCFKTEKPVATIPFVILFRTLHPTVSLFCTTRPTT